jgi:NitT/TauT family transport system ATP-binding protein
MLLMDEPFSALDVLHGRERSGPNFIDLWSSASCRSRRVLIVTHNIEEAVLMCDRILVFSSNPSRRVAASKLPGGAALSAQPAWCPAFRTTGVDDIYALMTRRAPSPAPAAAGRGRSGSATPLHAGLDQPAGRP